MPRVLLLGAGNIGVAIAELLKASRDFELWTRMLTPPASPASGVRPITKP